MKAHTQTSPQLAFTGGTLTDSRHAEPVKLRSHLCPAWEASSKHRANTALRAASLCKTRERLCQESQDIRHRGKSLRLVTTALPANPACRASCLRRGTPNHLPKPHIMPQNRYSRDFPCCKANSVICTDNREIELANEKRRKKLRLLTVQKILSRLKGRRKNSHCIALRSKFWVELQTAWH